MVIFFLLAVAVSGRHSAFKTRYVHTPALGVHCTCRIWDIWICEFLTEWEERKKYSRFLQLRAAVWDFFSVLLQISIFRPQNCYALKIFFGGIQISKRTEWKNERKPFSCEDKKFQLSGRNYVTISWNLHFKVQSASLSVSKKIQYMYQLKRHSPYTVRAPHIGVWKVIIILRRNPTISNRRRLRKRDHANSNVSPCKFSVFILIDDKLPPSSCALYAERQRYKYWRGVGYQPQITHRSLFA